MKSPVTGEHSALAVATARVTASTAAFMVPMGLAKGLAGTLPEFANPIRCMVGVLLDEEPHMYSDPVLPLPVR